VDVALGHHVVDEREVVDDLPERGDAVVDVLPGLPVPLPLPRRRERLARGRLEQLDLLARVPRLAVIADEPGLVVERVALAGRPGHEQLDHPLGPRRVVEDAGGGRGPGATA
jgi:hypothetical protein